MENEINTKIKFSKKNFYIPTELKEIEIISELKWNSIPYNLFFLSEETENFFSKSNKSEKEKINNSNDCIILYNKLEDDFSTKNLNSFSLDNKENISEGLKDDSFCLILDYSNLEDKENINDKKIHSNIESNLNKNIFEINIIEDYIINYIKNEVNISSSLNLNNKKKFFNKHS